MPTASREYVSGFWLGDYEACIQFRDAVVADIRALNINERVANFHAGVMTSPDDLVDEDVDVQQVTAVTGGRFPLLWLNITYNPERLAEERLQEIEQQHQLTLIATAQSRVDLM